VISFILKSVTLGHHRAKPIIHEFQFASAMFKKIENIVVAIQLSCKNKPIQLILGKVGFCLNDLSMLHRQLNR
jgi:hypothetical protein